MIDNYITIFENLPYKVNGFTMYNASDDYYTIVLNSRASADACRKTFEHEMAHIKNKDFSTYRNVEILESVLH